MAEKRYEWSYTWNFIRNLHKGLSLCRILMLSITSSIISCKDFYLISVDWTEVTKKVDFIFCCRKLVRNLWFWIETGVLRYFSVWSRYYTKKSLICFTDIIHCIATNTIKNSKDVQKASTLLKSWLNQVFGDIASFYFKISKFTTPFRNSNSLFELALC